MNPPLRLHDLEQGVIRIDRLCTAIARVAATPESGTDDAPVVMRA